MPGEVPRLQWTVQSEGAECFPSQLPTMEWGSGTLKQLKGQKDGKKVVK